VSRRKDDLLECNRGVYVDMLGLEAYFIGLLRTGTSLLVKSFLLGS
jgi:hypothetical protein